MTAIGLCLLNPTCISFPCFPEYPEKNVTFAILRLFEIEMGTWPTKLKLLTHVRSWQEPPSQVAGAQWKLDPGITEINPNYIFSSLAFCFLLVTGVNLPLEQEYVASLQYFQRQRLMADPAKPKISIKGPGFI